VLRRIFERKEDELKKAGQSRILRISSIFNLYQMSEWYIKKDAMGGACGALAGEEKCFKFLVGKPEWKVSFIRHRRRGSIILKLMLRK
jgi:hypothetical protein